jgi:uncharacterized Zn finger protein (UPF0148 family)
MPTDPTPQAGPLPGYWCAHCESQVHAQHTCEPSPAPQTQQGFRELKPMTDKDAAAKLREIFNDLQTRFHDQWDWMEAGFSLMVLETYLESVTEERDRAQDALRIYRTELEKAIPLLGDCIPWLPNGNPLTMSIEALLAPASTKERRAAREVADALFNPVSTRRPEPNRDDVRRG